MKKYFIAYFIMIALLTSSCDTQNKISNKDLDKISVKQTTDETVQDDFIFRLISEKEQYKTGEDVKIYGEILYMGGEEAVTINHSSSAIFFDIVEEIRGYKIDYVVNDIGISTTINRLGDPYQYHYKKSFGYPLDNAPKEYVNFIENFSKNDGFPPGYYTVKGLTDFTIESEDKRYNIEATIDFKVVD